MLGGAEAILKRCELLDNRDFGLRATGGGATVTAEDLVVERTAALACATDSCPELAGGFGIGSDQGAAVEVTRFRSSDNAMCGVLVATAGTMDLHEGEVSANPIGASVQTGGYDISRLEDGVLYLDNDRPLDSTVMVLSEPPEGLDL